MNADSYLTYMYDSNRITVSGGLFTASVPARSAIAIHTGALGTGGSSELVILNTLLWTSKSRSRYWKHWIRIWNCICNVRRDCYYHVWRGRYRVLLLQNHIPSILNIIPTILEYFHLWKYPWARVLGYWWFGKHIENNVGISRVLIDAIAM